MDCLECGFSNPDNARFCAGCGVSVASLDCPHCQSKNPSGSRFCTSCGNSLAQQQAPQVAESTQSKAERRLLTVMFCDLVDSTSIVQDLDPEETRAIIRDFQSHSRAVIEQFGGRITEYLGDGIVAQFTRHETNAERAINAALELIRKLDESEFSYGISTKKIQVRCGIATGLAVVGDMLGDAHIRSESAIGLPLNLAARIQNLANPNEIIIAGDTHRLSRGLFEFEDLGQHTLKGIKDPQPVWRVIKQKHVSSRFIAHTAEITPMVDRIEPMKALLETWHDCKQGQAATVVFSGEAGIGKSRILQEFSKKLASDDYYYLDYQCAPYHVNTSLYPLINRFEDAAEFEHGDDNAQRLQKLEALIRRSNSDFENVMPAFASLLGLQAEDRWPTPNLDPEEKKQWIFNALISNMFSLADSRPLLIKIEDVHWIDPTTHELMSRMVRSLPGHPVLLLITTRPGFSSDFMGESHVSLLEIERLPEHYTAQLVEGVKGSDALPRDVLDEVIKRTEGIPLFIEELSKSLLEGMNANGTSVNSSLLAKKDIPTTLHDSLLSRLDRLPNQSRFIAQLAAVIGREFSFDLLERVADYQDKNLYRDLTPLLESQLVFQDKAPPSAEFCFKHALVRDVAYENLLQSERVDIHKRIAQAIEENYPEIINNTPELVARHFTEGKDYEKAVQYWLDAGKKASQNSANVEARSHLEMGLSLIEYLSDDYRKNLYELELLVAIGPILITVEGAGAKLTRQTYSSALNIADKVNNPDLKFIALWNSWRISVNDGFPEAVKWADELIDAAKNTKDIEQNLQAHHCQWGTLYNLGDQEKCYEHILKGLELYDENEHSHHASIYGGHDPRICGHNQAALSLWLRGYPEKALIELNTAKEFTNHLNHLGSTMHHIDARLMFYYFLYDFTQLRIELNEIKILSEEHSLIDYGAKEKIFGGWVLGLSQDIKQGYKELEEGIKIHELSGTWEDKPIYLEMFAQIQGEFGLYIEGLSNINKAIQESEQSGVTYWNSELYRRKGELLLGLDFKDRDKIENCFYQAIEIAIKQGAKSLELRATYSQARYFQAIGDSNKAHRVLSPVYESFTEGFQSLDLKKAAKLLHLTA